jgi:uncharacterized membrane protein YfcA
MDIAYSAAGFVVGLVVGITGVGGGSLMTPLLVLVFGFPPSVAVGTDLLYAAATKAGGAAAHGLNQNIDWKIAGLLAAGSLPASLTAISFLTGLTGHKALNAALTTVLGFMLLLTAAALIYRQPLQSFSTRLSPFIRRYRTVVTVAVGAFLGAMVTLSSIGAGAVGVTALLFLFPAISAVRIVGTDIAHAVPLTLAAGLGHAWLGNVDWILLAGLLAGSLPGVMLGSYIAGKLPEHLIRYSLITLLIFAGGRFALR